MRPVRWLAVLSLAAGALAPAAATAQDPRLGRRLDSATVAVLNLVIDSVRRAGLPVEPLVQRALEGAAKQASSARIVAAVQLLARELGTARTALGPSSTAPELVAAASALRAGVRPADLTELRDRRGAGLTVSLAAVTDLVTSGVPPDSAAAAVLALAAARDDQIVDFRRAVERDIALGAPPAAAAAIRVNAALRDLAPGPARRP